MRKILIILGLILCGSALFGQSPRIRLNQITKDSLTGSVVLSGSDSNMVYSRDFFLNLTDSVLILFGDTLSTTATAFTGVATDLTLTGNGTVGNELKVDTAIIATVSALADSLAGIISSVTTDLTLTGDGSVATPLKVDTSVIATIKALADSVATRGTVSSVAVSAGTGISVSGSPITTSGTITVTNTAPNATHTGDVTGSSALTIANDAVTNSKMANMAQNTIKGRITASTGDPEDLTASQIRTILNVADGATANTGTVTSVSGTGTVNGISLSGTVTSSGNLTLGGTLSNVNLASQVTGTLPIANGGTNVTSLTANGILYGSSTSQVATSSNLLFNGSQLGINLNPEHALTVKGNLLIRNSQSNASVFLGEEPDNSTTFYFYNNGAVKNVFATNGFNYITGGNLGIGTNSSSSYRLSISANPNTNVAGIRFVDELNSKSYSIGASLVNSNNFDIYDVSAAITRLTINTNGNVGIGTNAPSAVLHLKAGTASANTAPLKFTSGTNLTTPEAGAIEWNGTNLFLTNSGATRQTINQGLTGSATLDFGSTSAQSSADLTVTVTGASDGDVVSLGVPNGSVNANTSYSAWVSAANTVTVRFNNYSSGSVDPASGTFKVFVTKF